MKLNLNGNETEKEINFKERLAFIEYWVRHIKSNPDKTWSSGQAKLIDSQIKSAASFYKKLSETPEGREKIRMLVEQRIANSKKMFKY